MRSDFLFLFSISTSFLFAQENITVDCTAGPVSTTFCYMTGDDNSFVITSNDGSALNLSIDEGQVESFWDEFIVLDSDGSELYNGYGDGGDVSGLTFQSLGDSLTVLVDEDTSISCSENGFVPITFTAACATCVNPQVDFEMVSDCLNGPQFFVDADVLDLGSATSLTISDNQGNSQSVSSTGSVQFGPFPNNTDVQLTVSNDDDANCSVSSGSITQDYCAITLVDCSAGPVSSSYCYPNNDTTQFEYVSSDGSPLNLTIDSGSVENNWDELIILDSDGITELYNGYGNGGDITGLTFQSSGDTIFFSVASDGSISCESGSASLIDGINYTVACATCVNPSAEYSVIDDCANGEQFLIDVNITDLGSASSVSISDNQGSAGIHVTQTGVTQMGPYPFQTEIIITVSNDEDVNCVINSSPIQLFACPPENDNCDGAIEAAVNADLTCNIVTNALIKTVTNKDKQEVVVSRNSQVTLIDEKGKLIEQHKLIYGATLFVKDQANIEPGLKVAGWDPYTRPIISEVEGIVQFTDIEDGVTVRSKTDELTGLSSIEVIDVAERPSAGKDKIPSIALVDKTGKPVPLGEHKTPANYSLPAKALVNLKDGKKLYAGEVLARIPLEGSKTKDITGGLPRVADLFEARKPKDAAVLAEDSGTIAFGKETKGKVRLVISPDGATKKAQNVEMLIPKHRILTVFEGERIEKGDIISDGPLSPHDILRLRGIPQLTNFIVNEIQDVYRLQGLSLIHI